MPFKFYIQDLYDRTEVTEPRGWDGIMSVLKRDFAVHGVFFKYTDGSIKLGFGCDGKILLEAAYQADGAEAFYMFEVDEADNELTTFTTIFSGEFDFKTRNFDEDFFDIDVSEINEIDKIKNKASLKTGLNKQLTYDGITVSKINSSKIVNLASKLFDKLVVINSGLTIEGDSGTQDQIWIQVGFDTKEDDDIKSFQNVTTEFRTISFVTELDHFLVLDKARECKIVVDFDYELNLSETSGSGTTEYTIQFILEPVKNSQAPFSFSISTDFNSAPSPNNYSSSDSGSITFYGKFESGFTFIVYMRALISTTGTAAFDAEFILNDLKITFTDLKSNFGTTAIWYHPFDALNKTLNFITGEYDYLFSQLLGDQERGYTLDGCFSDMRLTNGFRIRQIEDDDKAPIASFKDYINNFNVIGAIGYGIESLESPDFIPGSFAISWGEEYANIVEIIIIAENLIYDITVGDKIGFYNGETLYGTYEVLTVEYRGVIVFNTYIDIDISNNPDLFLSSGFDANIFITSDATTSFRDRLRVEKWEHFYGDNELINLGVVQEYSEEPFDDILYNEIGISFKKFANDEDKPTTLEDFETKSSWALPVTKSKKLLNLSMDWIMSTFMINESRNTLFAEKPTTSNKLDDNIFLCDIVPLQIDTTVTFVHNASDLDTIEVSADVYENYIRDEGIFEIIGATIESNNHGYLFDPLLVVHLLSSDTYKISIVDLTTVTSDTDDPCTVRGIIIEDVRFKFKAESNEKLSSSSGLTGTTYTYNQRRTMKRFLIRWGRYVSSILAYLVDSANVSIQNLFYINNGDFSSELDTSQLTDDCLMGDNSGALIREADNINSSALGTAKFKPNLINGTVKICDEDFDRIKDAHKNKLKVGVFDGVTYLESELAKADTNFIHQTGIFDITIKCSFTNFADTVNNSIPLYDKISGDGFQVYYSNSNDSALNQLGISLRSNGVSNYAYTDDIGDVLRDNEIHKIRFIGTGSDIILFIDDVEFFVNKGSFNYSGSLDSLFILTVGGGDVGSDSHIGNIESIKIINNLNEQIINYNFNNGTNTAISNTGKDAPASSSLVWAGIPAYESLGYGYLTMTSPNAKTVSGWLMEIKRNPVDRIAKVKLLESRFIKVGAFDGTIYGLTELAKISTDFIHQTGIFDITVTATFENISDTVFSNFLVTTASTPSTNGIWIFYTNAVSGSERQIQIYLWKSGGSNTYFSNDLGSLLNDGLLHMIRVTGNGSIIKLFIDGIEKTLSASAYTPGGGTSDEKLSIGAIPAIEVSRHIGKIKDVIILNDNGDEVMLYNYRDGNTNQVPNSGTDRAINSDLLWVGTGKYATIIDI